MTKETKTELKKYKDWLNKNHEGMHLKISDYSLNKYIKEQLTIHSVSVSFSKDDMKKCADFWNGKHIEQKYFDQYLNER